MRKYFLLAFSLLLIKGLFAQRLYMLPENFHSSTGLPELQAVADRL
jgi:hypothetical protein